MTTSVRVLGTTGSNNFETVNIQAADLGEQVHHHQHKVCVQFTAAQAAANPGQVKTVQSSNAIAAGATGTVANGLRTIIIPGSTAPA